MALWSVECRRLNSSMMTQTPPFSTARTKPDFCQKTLPSSTARQPIQSLVSRIMAQLSMMVGIFFLAANHRRNFFSRLRYRSLPPYYFLVLDKICPASFSPFLPKMLVESSDHDHPRLE